MFAVDTSHEPSTDTATRLVRRSPGARVLAGAREYAIVIATVALFVVFASTSDAFLTFNNIRNLVDQAAIVGIVACAGTLVIIAGAFDLSVGAVFAISGIIAAQVAQAADPTAGVIAGVLVGLVLGVINGLLVSVGRVNSFIATLASSIVIAGLTNVITGGAPVIVRDNPGWAELGQGSFLSIKYSTWIFITVAVVLGLLLASTSFGRRVYAVGENPKVARLSGIRVWLIQTTTFALSGTAAALAGVIVASRAGRGEIQSGTGLVFDVIAAIAIGGTSLLGGKGAVWRTVLGVIFLAMIANGFTLLGVPAAFTLLATGGIIVVAVAIDSIGRKSS